MGQFEVLEILKENSGLWLTAREICEINGVHKNSNVVALRKLSAAGWICSLQCKMRVGVGGFRNVWVYRYIRPDTDDNVFFRKCRGFLPKEKHYRKIYK